MYQASYFEKVGATLIHQGISYIWFLCTKIIAKKLGSDAGVSTCLRCSEWARMAEMHDITVIRWKAWLAIPLRVEIRKNVYTQCRYICKWQIIVECQRTVLHRQIFVHMIHMYEKRKSSKKSEAGSKDSWAGCVGGGRLGCFIGRMMWWIVGVRYTAPQPMPAGWNMM